MVSHCACNCTGADFFEPASLLSNSCSLAMNLLSAELFDLQLIYVLAARLSAAGICKVRVLRRAACGKLVEGPESLLRLLPYSNLSYRLELSSHSLAYVALRFIALYPRQLRTDQKIHGHSGHCFACARNHAADLYTRHMAHYREVESVLRKVNQTRDPHVAVG